MLDARAEQIESCLAFHALRHSSELFGGLTAGYLDCYLAGATYRAAVTSDDFPSWRINGVLDDHNFLKQELGVDTEMNHWRRVVDTNLFDHESFFGSLMEHAAAWHRSVGIDETEYVSLHYYREYPLADREGIFWPFIFKRPAMHLGSVTGWGFYCFLTGMTAGGDWLNLPKTQNARNVFTTLTEKSNGEFGNKFAAFRDHQFVSGLLEWSGLVDPNTEETIAG